MKKPYRILSLLLALMMVFSLLTGCWGDDEEEEEEDEDEEETEETSEEEEDEDEEETKDPSKPQETQPETLPVLTPPTVPETLPPTVPETVPPTIPETEPPTLPEITEPEGTIPETIPPELVPEDKEATLGRWEGNKYINEYCGLYADLDRLWITVKAETSGITNEDLPDLERGFYSSIVDMTATRASITSGDIKMLMVIYQSPYYAGDVKGMNSAELAEELVANKDAFMGGLSNTGFTVSTVEKTKATFLGEKTTAVKVVGSMAGTTMYITLVIDFFGGDIPVLVCGASLGKDSSAASLELFKPLG